MRSGQRKCMCLSFSQTFQVFCAPIHSISVYSHVDVLPVPVRWSDERTAHLWHVGRLEGFYSGPLRRLLFYRSRGGRSCSFRGTAVPRTRATGTPSGERRPLLAWDRDRARHTSRCCSKNTSLFTLADFWRDSWVTGCIRPKQDGASHAQILFHSFVQFAAVFFLFKIDYRCKNKGSFTSKQFFMEPLPAGQFARMVEVDWQ